MLAKRCKLLTGHIEELQSSTESLQAYKEAYRQCLTSVSEECRQRASVAVLLEERLQRERSWVRKLEGDLRRAASVLTAIATVTTRSDRETSDQKILWFEGCF
ncbi:hypothetical protein CHARACLAT_023440 [Characodon lateralis]|uniref:Uncharacterized protein n=1 Tax=Characodon lateralis TaxID=208331 RepID=A0ABU7DTL7_9TELE|nr:hypothetical protein [Characodon lateralis]